MPLIPIIIAGGVGFGGGLWLSGATQDVATVVKWGAILGVAFIAARAFKVI